MEAPMRAIEMTGTVDEERHLRVEGSLPVPGPMRVRVIVPYPEEDVEEGEWLRAAARNPAFDFLKDPEEDIYTLADGKPLCDQRVGRVCVTFLWTSTRQQAGGPVEIGATQDTGIQGEQGDPPGSPLPTFNARR